MSIQTDERSMMEPQTVIRTARKAWRCDCRLRAHEHDGPVNSAGAHFCSRVIQPGERYPEYLGEVAAFQSGHRYCPDCRSDQLGAWIEEAMA